MKAVAQFKAKRCWTAGGILLHQGKALLIKHKKLGVWLNPGGHIEKDELPHQAAEREFFEETGIKVKAYTPATNSMISTTTSEYLPQPLFINVHWFSKENYLDRVAGRPVSGKGCEQHLGFFYLVQPVNGLKYSQNIEETDGIGWFSFEETEKLNIFPEVKRELKLAFQLV